MMHLFYVLTDNIYIYAPYKIMREYSYYYQIILGKLSTPNLVLDFLIGPTVKENLSDLDAAILSSNVERCVPILSTTQVTKLLSLQR